MTSVSKVFGAFRWNEAIEQTPGRVDGAHCFGPEQLLQFGKKRA
jgi:hypothetical protein